MNLPSAVPSRSVKPPVSAVVSRAPAASNRSPVPDPVPVSYVS